MKESCQTLQILQAGNRLMKLFSCKCMLAFKEKEGSWWGQSLEHRGQNHRCRSRTLRPQRTSPRTWNVMEFALLGFEIGWDWWPFSSFHFSVSLSCNWNIYNTCTTPVSPLYLGYRYLIFQFYRSRDMEEFCPKMDHTQSLTHTWLRLFRWWDKIFEFVILKRDFGPKFML